VKNRLFETLLAAALIMSAGCSKRDKVINVEDNDPEMMAAIDKGRQTLTNFWQALENPQQGETKFALKVRIEDENGTEYFWASGIERKSGKIRGTIDNDPNIVKNVKIGQRIDILQTNIADWLYMRDGKMMGNYTLRALYKEMPPSEVEKYKKILAEP
jgi:uncharacterized protein YegJ (DUF2314 family)